MGIPSFLSPFHIEAAEALNLWALPQQQWMWHAVIADLPTGIDTGISSKLPGVVGDIASKIDNLKRAGQLVTLAKSINLPKKVIETTEVYFMGRKKKIAMAGTYEDNTFEMVFEDKEHQAVITTFTRWIDLISNTVSGSDSKIGNAVNNLLGITNTSLGSNYSNFNDWTSDIFIFMEMSHGIPNNFINIKRCFPININQTQGLDYSGNQGILYTVTFAFNEYSFISRQDIL